jgi:hypothetical protein
LHRNGEAIPLHFVAHNKTNKKIPQTGILVVYFQLLSSPKGGAGAGSNPGAAAGTPAQDARQHSSLRYINRILSSLDFL